MKLCQHTFGYGIRHNQVKCAHTKANGTNKLPPELMKIKKWKEQRNKKVCRFSLFGDCIPANMQK